MSHAYLVDVGLVVDKDEYPACYSRHAAIMMKTGIWLTTSKKQKKKLCSMLLTA